MANITIYQGAALATYEKIQAGIDEIYINKIYESKNAKCLFYINNKGYMHILTPGKTTLNGKIRGYHLTDNLLTKNNLMQYKNNYTKDFKTIQELQQKIIELLIA